MFKHTACALAALGCLLTSSCITGAGRSALVLTVQPLDGGEDGQKAFRSRVVRALGVPMAENATTDEAYNQRLTGWASDSQHLSGQARSAAIVNLRDTLIAVADRHCEDYLSAIGLNRRTYRGALTATGTVLGAAGSVATPARSASLLSLLSSVASGVRGNIEEEFFANQTLSILQSSMDAARDVDRQELVTALSPNNEGTTPSPELVIERVSLFNEQCTLTRALNYASAEAARNAQTTRSNTAKATETAPAGTAVAPAANPAAAAADATPAVEEANTDARGEAAAQR